MKRVVSVIIDRGDIPEAGGCWSRVLIGRRYTTYHPKYAGEGTEAIR